MLKTYKCAVARELTQMICVDVENDAPNLDNGDDYT